MTTPKDKTQLSVTIKTALVDRLEKESDARMVGKGLIVEKALESFLDGLPAVDGFGRPVADVPGT